MTVDEANAQKLLNPSCLVCSRKWARRHGDVTALLRASIHNGYFVAPVDPASLPKHVWARDPEDPTIVYKAVLLSHPPNGYKAYPLSRLQADRDIPFRLP